MGHYEVVDEPGLVTGDIEGEKIIHISSKADTVLAVSGKERLCSDSDTVFSFSGIYIK